MNSTISIASIEHKNDDNSRNIQNAVVKLQHSVNNGFKTCSSVGGAGNPNHFRIMLIPTWVRTPRFMRGLARAILHPTPTRIISESIRTRIQDPRLPRGPARQSWILDPGSNRNDSGMTHDSVGYWIQIARARLPKNRGSGIRLLGREPIGFSFIHLNMLYLGPGREFCT